MSHEILYTSAPRLLKSGASGYGTVVTTRGMGAQLTEKLESLSGYRWAFEQGDPQARQNPPCYSHLCVTVAGQRYHVLSRIADYGADYSGRSNKIAHHVALTESELPPGGPGWVMKTNGFNESGWDGELRVLESGRQPTRLIRPSADYSSWKRATGDAGWAGVLAETVKGNDLRAAHIIFALGTDTLGLVEEALNLLPHRDRWGVTFSTYYTLLPASFDCHWRFVLDGTPEATNIRRQSHQRVIDLCRPLGPALGGELVDQARAGWQPDPPGQRLPAGAPTSPPPRQLAPVTTSPVRQPTIASESYALQDVPPPVMGPSLPPTKSSRFSPFPTTSSYTTPSEPGGGVPWWAAIALCLLTGVMMGGMGFWFGHRSASQAAKASVSVPVNELVAPTGAVTTSTPPASLPVTPTVGDADGQSQPTPTQPPVPPSHSAPPPASSTGDSAAPKVPASDTPVANTHPTEMKVSTDPPKEAPPSEPAFLSLPDAKYVLDLNGEQNEQKIAEGIENLSPRVFGGKVILSADDDFELRKDKDRDGWEFFRSSNPEQPLATMRLDGQKVFFRWKKSLNKPDVDLLRMCRLQLNDKQPRKPLSEPLKIDLPSVFPSKESQDDGFENFPAIQTVLPKSKIGNWKLNGLPEGYVIDSPSTALQTDSKEAIVIKIESKGNAKTERLASIKVQRKLLAGDRVLGSVSCILMANFPGDDKPVPWSKQMQNPKSDKPFSPSSIADERSKINALRKRSEKKLDEVDQKEKTDQASQGIFNSMGYENQRKQEKEKLADYKRQDEKLNNLEEWRKRMDELTQLFEDKVTFSFDIWYDCDIDGTDELFILATATTSLKNDESSENK